MKPGIGKCVAENEILKFTFFLLMWIQMSLLFVRVQLIFPFWSMYRCYHTKNQFVGSVQPDTSCCEHPSWGASPNAQPILNHYFLRIYPDLHPYHWLVRCTIIYRWLVSTLFVFRLYINVCNFLNEQKFYISYIYIYLKPSIENEFDETNFIN